ncbi:MAG: hypothetical protein AAF411_00910 [Myxococcota bacterium]
MALALVLLSACASGGRRRFNGDADASADAANEQRVDATLPDGFVDVPVADDADTDVPDVGLDEAMPDMATPDLAADAPMPDMSMVDMAMPDTRMPDMAMPDTAMPDEGMPDMAMPDEGVLPCSGSECTFFPACGCGADACYVNGGVRTCSEPGSLPSGSVCSAFDECAPGLVCIPVFGSVRQCTPACTDDGPCTGGATCSRSAGDGGTTGACTFDCDLRTNEGCAPNAYCLPLNRGGRIVSDCTGPAGTLGRGDRCESTAECQRGFTCAATDGSSTRRCRQWCRAGRDSDCSGRDECGSIEPEIRIDGQRFGICLD